MNSGNKLKIFVGPIEVAGYYKNLSAGFAMLGVRYDFFTFKQHGFFYGGESKRTFLLNLVDWFNQFRGKPGRTLIVKIVVALPSEFLQILWALFAVFRYDVFVFGYGCSLVRGNFDLPIIKLFGKTIIVNVGHGAELRPPYIDGAHQSPDGQCQPTSKYLLLASLDRIKRIRFLEKYATYILGAPFSSTQFSVSRIVNFFAIGVPYQQLISAASFDAKIRSDICGADSHQPPGDSVCIVHSPSHPAAKGTARIRLAIQNLRAKGYSIEFVELVGKKNQEVISAIQHCDFVVDQLFSDTPMAGFATEAAWSGKPAVVGGYAFDYLKTLVPEGMWPPSKTCRPEEIEQAIEDLIVNREERLRLGAEAQAFVRNKWNAAEVARRYLRLIEGDIPEEWWLDPKSVTYLEGGGQPVERTKENIRQMVEQFGVASLQLNHRPDLERAFVDFAGVKVAN